MSSATSTDDHGLHPPTQSQRGGETDPGLRPWQFFLLLGMLAATGVVLVAAGQSPASIIMLSLTVVAASVVAVAAYRSLAPLVVRDGGEAPQLILGHTRAALEREKTLVLRAIKDLEFDFAMKKVAQRDFDEMSVRLRARALGLMRQLDTGGGYKEAIEREIANRLGSAHPAHPGAPAHLAHPGAPSAPSAPSASTSAPAGATVDKPSAPSSCSCGALNDRDARFCKNCGARLDAS